MFGKTASQLSEKARKAFAGGTDLVEFRVDSLRPPIVDEIKAELLAFRRQSVLTVRPTSEGGWFEGSEAQRLELIKALAELRPALFDVELRTLEANPNILSKRQGLNLIVSWHDPVRTPGRARLRLIMSKEARFAGFVKLVTTARSAADAITILSLYDGAGRPPIAFCMGVDGIFSRVMAMELGTPLTYASLDGEPSAPGQLTLGQMLAIRRRLQDA